MDSDIMNMMMLQMEKLPEFCNPNSSFFFPDHNNNNNHNTYPFLFNSSHNHSDHSMTNEPDFRYGSAGLLTNLSSLSPNTAYSSVLLDKRNNSNSNNSTNMAAMREMIFRIAVMQPIHIDPEAVKPPKRRNVRISKDPQSVAARHRRERISERIRILQRLVPGGTKMDTASMLDEAIHYVKFLKKQVQSLEEQAVVNGGGGGGRVLIGGGGMAAASGGGGGSGGVVMKGCGAMGTHQMVGNAQILR